MQAKTTIFIERLQVYAHHGVLPQERTVGANFYVSLQADVDVSSAALQGDQLEGTVDYGALTEVIRQEMSTPSQLLEHVAWRIGTRLLHDFPTLLRVEVEVVKENPPLGQLCQAVGVRVSNER